MSQMDAALQALKQDNLPLLEDILKKKPKLIDSTDEDDRTIFHWACVWNKIGLLSTLISFSADLDHQDDGWCALHSTSSAGLEEVVQFLISNGAKVDLRTTSKSTALHYAASKGHLNIMRSLIKAGSPINAKDKYGNTALSKSCANGHLPAVLYLISAGANCLTQENQTGDTALHIAVNGQHQKICLALCEYEPILLTIPNNDRVTPFDAAKSDLREVLKQFLPQ